MKNQQLFYKKLTFKKYQFILAIEKSNAITFALSGIRTIWASANRLSLCVPPINYPTHVFRLKTPTASESWSFDIDFSTFQPFELLEGGVHGRF